MTQKIVFLIRNLEYGGAQRQLVTLAKNLNQKSFEITVLYFYSGPLKQDLEASGISAISLEKQSRWDLFKFFWRLIKSLQQIGPDILHGYLWESNLLILILKPLFPSTCIIWGIRESEMAAERSDWLGNFIFKLACLLARFTDLIIVNSYAGRNYHITQGFPEEKMIVIPNGIDTERFQPNQNTGVKLREEWQIPKEKILVGLVARFDPMKDHSTFLKAAAQICQERNDIHFVCVGKGAENYTEEMHNFAENMGLAKKVIWAGACANMPAVYNSLNILVSSSAYGEGFSNVIGEAMACGVPCIVTDVGDSAWIIGNTGIVILPKNPQALVDAIKELSQKTNQENGEYIRRRIIIQFSITQLVNKSEEAFTKLLK